MLANVICWCRFQIFELWHTFKGFIKVICVIISFYILLTRHGRMLSFLCVYLRKNLFSGVQ
jgi:hypothetical protein